MTTTINIKGMSCNHCVMAVSQALKQMGDVRTVNVDLDNGKATIEHENAIDMSKVKEIIEKAGYEIG
ncbi:MAG: heavy-metal-associated domain-containing protein [Desulfomonilaceae bacterium]